LGVPLFILAGEIMNNGGVTRRIVRLSTALVGHITGGLAHVLVVAEMIISGMSGTAYGDAAGLGTILIKAMKEQGYRPAYAAALTAAASTIGPIIPPSIAMVVYGSITGTSVGALFLGGFIPGILMGGGLMITAYVIGIKEGHPRFPRPTLSELSSATIHAILPLLLPMLIMGGIIGGWFTPTEAAAFAVIYAFALSCLYRELSWKGFFHTVATTFRGTASVMVIIGFASLFGWLAIREQVPAQISQALLSVSKSPFLFLTFINVLFLILGCFMETIAIMLLVVPVLFPLLPTFGISPVHFGVVMILNLMIGLITPPVGICLYIVTEISKEPFGVVVRQVLRFYIPLIIVLLLITYIPELVLFVPRLFGL
jgi:tripartite ATP-independent transporter DctM subunit